MSKSPYTSCITMLASASTNSCTRVGSLLKATDISAGVPSYTHMTLVL
jgi:hypothetical protein